MSGYGYHLSKCGSGAKGLAGVGALVAVVIAAEVIARAFWWIVAGSAAGVIVSLAAVVLLTRPLRRWEREAAAELARTRPARLAALRASGIPQVTATVVPQAVEQHVYHHLVIDGPYTAPVIQIPGQSGAITGRN